MPQIIAVPSDNFWVRQVTHHQSFYWVHQDGSECDEFLNPKARPADLPSMLDDRYFEPMKKDQGWWCTTHQQEMVIRQEIFDPRPWQGGDLVVLGKLNVLVWFSHHTQRWSVVGGNHDYTTEEIELYDPELLWRTGHLVPKPQQQSSQLREALNGIREDAWYRGYDACVEGKQRHNPYDPRGACEARNG